MVLTSRAEADPTRGQVLDAAETLFYARGIRGVGMDDIRSASGVPLKRLYREFAGKEQIVVAFLERRDVRWRERLASDVEAHVDPCERLLAVFDWLGDWFAEPGFRGCAWINAYGELGGTSEVVARLARDHKAAFRSYLDGLAADAGLSADFGAHVWLLAEGAMVAAGIFRETGHALQARQAAAQLIAASSRADAAATGPARVSGR